MMTDSIGQLVNQTTGSKPNDSAIQANRPESGFISRFFQTSALTVGMTKNGAITIRRSDVLPEHRLVHQQRDEDAAADADHQHRADEDERVEQRGEVKSGSERKAA